MAYNNLDIRELLIQLKRINAVSGNMVPITESEIINALNIILNRGFIGIPTGDMEKAVYDPQGIEADVFDRANHTGQQLASTISDLDDAITNSPTVVNHENRITSIEGSTIKASYYEIIDTTTTTGGTTGSLQETPPSATINLKQYGEAGNAFHSTLTVDGVPAYQTPTNSQGEAIDIDVDVNGNWTTDGNFTGLTAIIYSISIDLVDWDEVDRDKLVDVFQINSFDQLPDTPSSKIGNAFKTPVVSENEGALEYKTIYDGYDSEANILARNASLHINQLWWAEDVKTSYKAVTNISGFDVWQPIGLKYDASTDAFCLTPTQDGQTQNIGQETFFLAQNQNGTGATQLDPKVFISTGSVVGNEAFQGVVKVKADDISSEGRVIGVNTTSLNIGEYGKVITYGEVKNVNTSAWNINDMLYVSPDTAGELTNIKPTINSYVVGKVLKSDATTGILFITSIASSRIDQAQVTVGVSKAFFTGDQETTPEDTFYLVIPEFEGTVPTATFTIPVPDNSIVASTEDHVTPPFTDVAEITAGLRDGVVDFSVNIQGGDEKIYCEVYSADGDGAILDSGIVTEPVGDLGVRPIFTLATSLLVNIESNDRYQPDMRGLLTEDFPLLVGNRLRFHFLCQKIGAAGGTKTFTIYFGSDHDTYVNIFQEIPSTFLDLQDTPDSYSGQAGRVPKVNDDEDGLEFIDIPPGSTDQLVKVSATDTTAQYLLEKLIQGSNITITQINIGGVEQIQISSTAGPGTDQLVKVSTNDTTAAFLFQKLISTDSSISFSIDNASGDENVDFKTSFDLLPDTPSTKVGQALKVLAVNASEDGIVYLAPQDAPRSFTAFVGNRAQANSTLGNTYIWSENTNNQNQGSTAGTNNAGISNGDLHPLGPGDNRVIENIFITAAAAAVGTNAVGTPSIRLEFYGVDYSSRIVFATIDVPVNNPSEVQVFNNLGGTGTNVEASISGLNVSIPNGKLWGVNFININGNTEFINAISRFYITVEGTQQ